MPCFGWKVSPPDGGSARLIAERDGAATAYVYAAHSPWKGDDKRFGNVRAVLHPDLWRDAQYESLLDTAEEWLVAEGAETAVTRARQSFEHHLTALARPGHPEVRPARTWSLAP